MMKSTKRKKPARVAADRTVSPLDAELPKQSESLPGQQEIPGLPVDLPTVDAKGRLVPRPSLVPFLRELDLLAFLDNWTVKEMQAKVKSRYGSARLTRVSVKEFLAARAEACSWWKCCRLYSELSCLALTDEQWDRLKRAATYSLDQMRGRTLRQCVRLIRTKAPCNSHILRGLPSRFHVWK